MKRTGILVGLMCIVGCGSDARVRDLELRVAGLEKEIAELKGARTGAEPVASHPDWIGVALDSEVEKGLAWLVAAQGADGGWGQDGGHEGDARGGVKQESSGNDVANTAIVALALVRSGTTLTSGPHRDALRKAVDFILAHVEESSADGLEITKRKGTQIQRKLGPYVDTFLATMLLSEIDGAAADEVSRKRAHAALEKCVAKTEKNQQKDGSWNVGEGWARGLSTSLAGRGLYMARGKVAVDRFVLEKNEEYQQKQYDPSSKGFGTSDSAGVTLYSSGAALETANRSEKTRSDNSALLKDIPKMLENPEFLKGFGSMGGEEFVSYLNISDGLIRTGGEPWMKWNGRIKEHLVKLQNQDGTWAGQHCITGRVACTAAAVLTLLAERTGPRS